MALKVILVSILSFLPVSFSIAQEAQLTLECKGKFKIARGSGDSPQELSFAAYDIFRINEIFYSTEDGDSKFILAKDGTVEFDSDTVYLTDGNGQVHTISRLTGLFQFSEDYSSDMPGIALISSNIICSPLKQRF